MSNKEDIPTANGTQMIPEQRRAFMLKQLREHQVLSVQQLTRMFACSHMTVRRDIAVLEQEGQAYSVTGGVRIATQLDSEPSHKLKAVLERPQKLGMARLAASLLRANMTVYLDAGTSTLEIVPHILRLSGMTVVTNDFVIVAALIDSPEVTVIHTGGLLDHLNRSSVGGLAAATLRQVASDIAFMSTSSWDLQRGTTTPSPPKVEVKQAAMHSASVRVLVATSSKYGSFSSFKVASLDQFDTIITDDGLAAAAESIRQMNIQLMLTP